jgi:hypothetical protein
MLASQPAGRTPRQIAARDPRAAAPFGRCLLPAGTYQLNFRGVMIGLELVVVLGVAVLACGLLLSSRPSCIGRA